MRAIGEMNTMPRLLKVLLVVLAIPAFGFAVSLLILNVVDRALLIQSSLLAAAIGILIPLLYWLVSIFTGESRERIALLFPVILRVSILLIAISVFLQGAILTYGAFIVSYYIGGIHILIIGSIGFGALVGGYKLIRAAMSFGGKLEMRAWGKVLNNTDAPELFGFVRSIAEKLGAKEPRNIVVGLEPTFYVTNSNIQVPGYDERITGETLYVSAPLTRLLSKEEFAAVIGHELGHFRGNDTIYSMRFAPVYAGLGKALGTLAIDGEDDVSDLAKLPAIAMLSYMHELFATNVAKISRDREYKADKAGAEAGSAMALSSALIKISLYSGLWNHLLEQNVKRLNQGKIATNLSVIFQDIAKYDIEHKYIEQTMKSILEQSISHPTDSHPPISTRLKALGTNLEKITKDILLMTEDTAIHLLDKSQEIEEEITLLEHKLMVAKGFANPPEEVMQNYLLYFTYAIAAAMILVDGKIDPNEVAVAEVIGQKLFDDFDTVEFREYLNNPEMINDVTKQSEAMREVLENEYKCLIIEYLRAISEADGIVSENENLLLHRIAVGMGISSSLNDT